MLKVTLHPVPVAQASPANCIGWLDIAYEKLAPVATYKALLYANRLGACAPVLIENYPRWSGSLWDLVARALALSLTRREAAPPAVAPAAGRRFAYARQLSAVVDHVSMRATQVARRLGNLTVRMDGQARGHYVAAVEEDILGSRGPARLSHQPAVLTAWDLVLRALVRLLGGADVLPPRPALIVPEGIVVDGRSVVPLGHLLEPARTGFERWLHWNGIAPVVDVEGTSGVVDEALYLRFLSEQG